MAEQSIYEAVEEFYVKFKQGEFIHSSPSLSEETLSSERLHLRMKLIAEEFFELVEATFGENAAASLKLAWKNAEAQDDGTRDLVETADALADMIYVIVGLALEAGIDLDAVFREVHRSNLSKLDDRGEPIISDGITPSEYDGKVKPAGKILKSKKFTEPQIAKILGLES